MDQFLNPDQHVVNLRVLMFTFTLVEEPEMRRDLYALGANYKAQELGTEVYLKGYFRQGFLNDADPSEVMEKWRRFITKYNCRITEEGIRNL